MSTAASPVASRANLLKGYLALSALLTVLVLVQAWMAGASLFGSFDILVHGIVGNISYLVAVGALVIALVVKADKVPLGVGGLLVALMTLQIGLGYTGRSSAEAASWHVPIGVAIFGLAVFQLTVAVALARDTNRADRLDAEADPADSGLLGS